MSHLFVVEFITIDLMYCFVNLLDVKDFGLCLFARFIMVDYFLCCVHFLLVGQRFSVMVPGRFA